MSKFIFLSVTLISAALVGFAQGQTPEGDPESELREIRAQEAQLKSKLATLEQRQLELQKQNGLSVKLEMKGRLEKKVVKAQIASDPDAVVWAVASGAHRYELSFGISPTAEGFVKLAEKTVGKTVRVTGVLAAPRLPLTQVLTVRTFDVLPPDPGNQEDNAELLKGLTVAGTLKQVIGTFDSFGRPSVGNTFEIDLSNLPKEKIVLTRPKESADFKHGTSYMPFGAAMTVSRVQQVKKETGPRRTVIELSAIDRHGQFVIRIMAEDLAKGSKVVVIFYHPSDFLGSMAEAEGVLK